MGSPNETNAGRGIHFNTMLQACDVRVGIASADPRYAKKAFGSSPSGVHANIDCEPGKMGKHCHDCFGSVKPSRPSVKLEATTVFAAPQSRT